MRLSEKWNERVVTTRPYTAELITDASRTGYGCVHKANNCTQEAAGFWDVRMSQEHSNVREAMAVLLGLRAFASQNQGGKIKIVSDNVSTISNINRLGGPSKALCKVVQAIWALAFRHDIELQAQHLSGVLNTHSDALSRLPPLYEWRLHPAIFHLINSR